MKTLNMDAAGGILNGPDMKISQKFVDQWGCLPPDDASIYQVLKFFSEFFRYDRKPLLRMTKGLCRSIRAVRSRYARKIRDRS